jgi:5,10-methylenetetrahydrofolate reductase
MTIDTRKSSHEWEKQAPLKTNLMQLLESDSFVVTGELAPPKGADKNLILERTRVISDFCDAINVTDNVRGIPSMSSAAGAYFILQEGAEPVMQISTRDRNRISIESELYSAYALGIRNLLFITGDNLIFESNHMTKLVYDVDSIQALRLTSRLMSGFDIAGNELEGTPEFFLGATFNPYAESIKTQVARTEEKQAAGARFFQTQAIFDTTPLESFMDLAADLDITVLAGIIPIKSLEMAEYMNNNVPGIKIPDALIKRLEAAGKGLKDEEMLESMRAEGLLIAEETIKAVRKIKGIHGLHLMCIGWEESIPVLVKKAGLYPRPKSR